ncbi:VMAP-C domain-containing protein [Nonomuraea rubra]
MRIAVDEAEHGGSGFFIAPGLVLTCAHVVATAARGVPRVADSVIVRWRRRDHSGVVIHARPWSHGEEGLWDYPDLAVVQLTGPVPDHPSVSLTAKEPDPFARLVVIGYHKVYDAAEPGLGGAAVEYVTPQELRGGWLLKVKDDELAPGMSGGPVVDLSTGRVCGVAKTTRQAGGPYGGLVVPIHALPRLADDGNPGAWLSLPPRVRAVFPLAEFLTPDEQDELREICRTLSRPTDLSGLYRRVVGELAPDPPFPLRDVHDLLSAVADTLAEQDGMPRFLPLIKLLAAGASPLAAARLDTLARGVTTRLGLEARYARWREPAVAVARRSPSLEIQLVPSGVNRRLYLLGIWLYRDGTSLPVAKFASDMPRTIKHIKTHLGEVVGDCLDDLPDEPDDILVAFVLPPNLITEPVDQWHLSKALAPLGTQYPVVVRSLRRPRGSGPHRRQRWQWVQAHTPDKPLELSWIDCKDTQVNGVELHAWFQNAMHRAVLGVPYLPTTRPAREALEAAAHAGVPVMLWRRGGCDDHGESGEDCAGRLFRINLTTRLTGTSLRELPQLVRELRAEALQARSGTHHCGDGLAVLWDDPDRLPLKAAQTACAPTREE